MEKEFKTDEAEGICPKCNGGSISYSGDIVRDDAALGYKARCSDCGLFFTEWYLLVFDESIGVEA